MSLLRRNRGVIKGALFEKRSSLCYIISMRKQGLFDISKRQIHTRFIKSAVNPEGYPKNLKPEVALMGRSNAGKSSLLNALVGSRKAKVSGQPGKTALLNFFEIGKHYHLVDMPGYGFAARSHSEREEWKTMVETYLSLRSTLCGLVLVMDIRRSWSADEQQLVDWLKPLGVPVVLVLTKSDKLGKNAVRQKVIDMKKHPDLAAVFAVSSLKRQGVDMVENFVFEDLVKSYLRENS